MQDPDSFKSSAASPDECLQSFRRASELAENILCITVSVELSATYNSALDGKDLAVEELPGISVTVLDSYSATPSEGFVALAAARAAAEGKELEKVIKTAEEVRDKVKAIIFLDTIQHVYRSGRIPKVASQIGTMLNIKPILTVSGRVHFTGAVRNRIHGIERIIQMMKDRVGESPVHAAVMHAYAPDEAERLKERIANELNCIEIWVAEFSPVMGYACGTGTVGIAFYTEE